MRYELYFVMGGRNFTISLMNKGGGGNKVTVNIVLQGTTSPYTGEGGGPNPG